MLNRSLPYFLEDRTGIFTHTDFDDIYDRLFLKVFPHGHTSQNPFLFTIHSTARRSTPHEQHHSRRGTIRDREPSLTLEFGPRGALGNVVFSAKNESVPMAQWLKKTSMFGGSMSRKFRASDGEEYRWIHQGAEGQEWTLVDSRDYLVAHYNFKPADKPAYSTSGNVLTIYETHGHIAVEILASLTIMRHIAAHNL
ncbi:hypothetical protein BC835DRAFT_1072133 [Cytidiella melzeri]|nr:hypothetical protein BC835DRAFT_1072133 [Cytidiella melzeri]